MSGSRLQASGFRGFTLTTNNRVALAAWAIAAAAGTVGVWWLSGYLESLVTLAETDRAGAIALFRSRALPALVGIVAIAVAAGAVLMRQGLQLVTIAAEAAASGVQARNPARTFGWMMAAVGFVMAAVPLAMLATVFWILRSA